MQLVTNMHSVSHACRVHCTLFYTFALRVDSSYPGSDETPIVHAHAQNKIINLMTIGSHCTPDNIIIGLLAAKYIYFLFYKYHLPTMLNHYRYEPLWHFKD